MFFSIQSQITRDFITYSWFDLFKCLFPQINPYLQTCNTFLFWSTLCCSIMKHLSGFLYSIIYLDACVHIKFPLLLYESVLFMLSFIFQRKNLNLLTTLLPYIVDKYDYFICEYLILFCLWLCVFLMDLLYLSPSISKKPYQKSI